MTNLARVAPAPVPAPRGFFSVPARHAGRVVARVSSSGLVWAWRAMRKGDLPSPRCLFVPVRNPAHAAAVSACVKAQGWQAQTKPGTACAVYRAGPLSAFAPPLAVKVRLPAGISSSVARAQLRAAWLNLVRP
ncbi:hypothetical protein BDD21_5416 [Thiocapsa rosea]|uniref:Uncharacterized protein n=2 Tax=Thiocapsa rosea TaxID=69360 RepID=A0A495UNT6_9GAMM|nr:hypothetical protein BDD21_5416 [Thiocapsa rosea]